MRAFSYVMWKGWGGGGERWRMLEVVDTYFSLRGGENVVTTDEVEHVRELSSSWSRRLCIMPMESFKC